MKFLISSLIALTIASSAIAQEKPTMNLNMAPEIKANNAEIMKAIQPDSVVFIDVRSRAEAAFQGVAVNTDALIPFADYDFNEWDSTTSNWKYQDQKDFVANVEKFFKSKNIPKNRSLIVLCSYGHRGPMITKILYDSGFKNIQYVRGGFAEWTLQGFSTTKKIPLPFK